MSLTIWLFFIVIALIAGLILGLRKYKKIKEPVGRNKDLITDGKKIQVFLNECDIISAHDSRNASEEHFPARIEVLDSFSKRREEVNLDITKSVLVYHFKDEGGREISFNSEVIVMPVETLRYYLDKQMVTHVFVDNANAERYYFDISFLNSGK